MPAHDNPLSTPLDAIVFDCDGTLSYIEGIDELAKLNGVDKPVTQLTAAAMGQSGINPQLYAERLNLVLPTSLQVDGLGDNYFQHKAPDLLAVLAVFAQLNKAMYIVSAGLYPAVARFAGLLNIPTKNVFAVDIYFDTAGKYRDFDHYSPLVTNEGKRAIALQLQQRHPRVAYIGDGLNDVAVKDVVTRFIGYGGAYYRENIQRMCEYYITTPSLLGLLSLCLTLDEMAQLGISHSYV